MNTVKITKRETLNALIEAIDAGRLTMTGDIAVEDIRSYAENEIELLDKRAVKAKERAAKAKAEGDELTEVVYDVMTEDFETIADIASRIEGEDLTVAKVGARLRKLVEAGRAEKGELKFKPEGGGKTTTKVAYRKL